MCSCKKHQDSKAICTCICDHKDGTYIDYNDTIESFIIDRLNEVEECGHAVCMVTGSSQVSREIFNFVMVGRRLVELAKDWPVMVTEKEPEIFSVNPLESGPNEMRYKISQRIEFMTRQEYVKKFGSGSPHSPALMALAYCWHMHPAYNSAWTPSWA